MTKPNVLVIIVDCLRADAVFGMGKGQRPVIDRLVAESTAFTQAISTTTTTTPSVASLLTGTYPFAHGILSLNGYKLSPDTPSIAEVLRAEGYHTYADVVDPLAPEAGIDRGFDRFVRYAPPNAFFEGDRKDGVLREFRDGKLPEPWFFVLHLWELHTPRRVRDSFNTASYGANQYERALSSLDPTIGELLGALPRGTTVLLTGDHGERIYRTSFQDWLGDRLEAWRFEKSGPKGLVRKLAERYLAGQGLERTGHGFHIYDDLIRVPLLIRGDGFPAGRRHAELVRQIDIAPTILDSVGLPGERWPNMHGRSILPLVKGEPWTEEPAYCEACGVVLPSQKDWRSGIRTSRWKYVYGPYNPAMQEELYDLVSDPGEKNNLAASQPEMTAGLKRQIIAIRETPLSGPYRRPAPMTEDEEAVVEERLRALGYIS